MCERASDGHTGDVINGCCDTTILSLCSCFHINMGFHIVKKWTTYNLGAFQERYSDDYSLQFIFIFILVSNSHVMHPSLLL